MHHKYFDAIYKNGRALSLVNESIKYLVVTNVRQSLEEINLLTIYVERLKQIIIYN